MAVSCFSTLPKDIKLLIFFHCDDVTLSKVVAVCKDWASFSNLLWENQLKELISCNIFLAHISPKETKSGKKYWELRTLMKNLEEANDLPFPKRMRLKI